MKARALLSMTLGALVAPSANGLVVSQGKAVERVEAGAVRTLSASSGAATLLREQPGAPRRWAPIEVSAPPCAVLRVPPPPPFVEVRRPRSEHPFAMWRRGLLPRRWP